MAKQNNTIGFYMSSFFRLHISTQESLEDLENWKDLDFSVFLHEYVHFLQDISTYYGLTRTNAIVEYLRFANNQILKDSVKEFETPIVPDPNNTDHVLLNSEIAKLTYGDSKTFNINKIKSYKTFDQQIKMFNSPIDEIKLVEVCCDDVEGNERQFIFGARCIMESMAFLLEQLSCSDFHPSPDLPYHSAELLAEHIHSDFAKDKLNILALCDISLGVSNPGSYFIMILEKWKTINSVPDSPEALYEDHKKQEFSVNAVESKEDHLKNMSEQIKLQLRGYFNDARFDSLKIWIDHLLDKAIQFRNDYPSFIIDMARTNIRTNPTFALVLNSIGTPMLTNDNKEFISYNAATLSHNIPIGFFWAIREILNIFQGRPKLCELVGFCKQPQANTKVDFRCYSPWLRSKDIQPCPVGLMWKHWGLKDYAPII